DWIQIHPGTSGAVALGVARLLLAGGATLPTDRVKNADAFETLISTYTPDAVAAISGIDPARLARLADQLKDQGPAIIVVDSRSLSYSNGVDTALAAFALDAVLGGHGVRNAPIAPLRAWTDPALDAIATA